METSERNLLKFARNQQVRFTAEIPNQRTCSSIDEEVIGNPEKRIPGINGEIPDDRISPGDWGQLTDAGWKKEPC
jgi:hypothetical protein